MHELQRRRRRTWGSGLFLLQDRARHLVPYWQDQDDLARLLQDHYPHYGLTVARRYPAQRQLEVMLPECRASLAARPNATDVVLVVSDLGVLSGEPADREFWIEFGRDLNQAGLLAIALTPCQPDHLMVGPDPRFDRPVEVNLWQQEDQVTARLALGHGQESGWPGSSPRAPGTPDLLAARGLDPSHPTRSPTCDEGREAPFPRASWLGHITTLNRRVVLSPREGDRAWTPDRPAWANTVDRDPSGWFADFEFRGVTQRLRWIPAGSFRIGSPDTEAGRYDNEGPCHEVTLSSGFWLFDTPCTQALWQAVMGKNPSNFVSPDRLVDSVSWEAAQEFVQRLNGEIPGLDLTLPTEAQWEYACRAGTSDATWLGDLEILGDSNAPLLDAIAWYGGNSGVEFDLDNGWDSSGWHEKQ